MKSTSLLKLRSLDRIVQIRRYATDRNYSTALGIFPEYYEEQVMQKEEIKSEANTVKDYSEIPGPKGLPIIGNSWRFAPIIGM